jgi:hypothetical protein
MPSQVTNRATRQVYLITFSSDKQFAFPALTNEAGAGRTDLADMSRQDVADLVLAAYSSRTGLSLTKWAVFRELHAASPDDSGDRRPHFHMAVKANKIHRWAGVADFLRHEGVHPNFASTGPGYESIIRYCTQTSESKSEVDSHPLLSPGHPALPRATSGSQGSQGICCMRA